MHECSIGLVLNIYDDQPQVPIANAVTSNEAQSTLSSGIRLLRRSTLRRNSIQSMQADESEDVQAKTRYHCFSVTSAPSIIQFCQHSSLPDIKSHIYPF